MQKDEKKMKIMFVCTGNTCRSAMADGYFTSLVKNAACCDLSCSSCGLVTRNGLPANPNSVKIAEKYGFSLGEHRATLFTKELGEGADMILCMTREHKKGILSLAPALESRISILTEYDGRGTAGVEDPFGGTLEVYEQCFLEMKRCIDKLFSGLLAAKNN